MPKNYEILYKHLKATLKSEREIIKKNLPKLDDRFDLAEKLEDEGRIGLLDWLFDEYIPELEGIKRNNIFLGKEEFKKWKKKINVK